MTYAAFPAITPSTSSYCTKRYRALTAQFGGNYVQSAPDGINNIVPVWTVTFENLTAAQVATMDAFLDSVGAWSFFTWTPPAGNGTVWRIDMGGSVSGVKRTTMGLVTTLQFDITMVY